MERGEGWSNTIDDELRAFLAERDSFYLATANAEGQPYIQHRGSPPGFVRVLNDRRHSNGGGDLDERRHAAIR